MKYWIRGLELTATVCVLVMGLLGFGCGKNEAPPKDSNAGGATAKPVASSSNAPTLMSLQQPQPKPTQPRQVLYNGLALDAPWPPRYPQLNAEPQTPPYLRATPSVLPIDIGRQLFVDSFIIDSASNMTANYHLAEAYGNNPVLQPDKPWESDGPRSDAMSSAGGVWYDQEEKLFKMWYGGAGGNVICLAVSTNGTNWSKPALDPVKDSNIVWQQPGLSATVWRDVFDPEVTRRYKMFRMDETKRYSIYYSGNGINWGTPVAQSEACAPGSTVMYNPVRQVWIYGLLADSPFGRAVKYYETKQLVTGSNWNPIDPQWWMAVDRFDLTGPDARSQMLGLTVIPYESLLVGLFTLGDPSTSVPKPNKIQVGFSRDGFHWTRPDRRAFIPLPQKLDVWNATEGYPSPGGFLMVGRRLQFFTTGRSATGVGSTGLSTLRRDGFVSMDAETNGVLTTWPVSFTGKFLFVNVDNPNGDLRVEILDQDYKVIPPFTKENAIPINLDSTLILANWKDVKDLSQITGKPVRFRFHLNKGSLYSFWVSPTFGGASRGFIAGGGPHYTMQIDSVGTTSYRPLPVVSNLIPGKAAGPMAVVTPAAPSAPPPATAVKTNQ